MAVWILTGSLLIAIAAPASGPGRASPIKLPAAAKPAARVIEAARTIAYRLPIGLTRTPSALPASAGPDRRISRSLLPTQPLAADPQAISVRDALRDRLARKGGPLSRGLEWRLDGNGSDLGFGGGLKRIVDALSDQ